MPDRTNDDNDEKKYNEIEDDEADVLREILEQGRTIEDAKIEDELRRMEESAMPRRTQRANAGVKEIYLWYDQRLIVKVDKVMHGLRESTNCGIGS
jgi:hypothetical protein